MTIGIVGNYGNDNEGDEAILAGIITQLEDAFRIERQNIVVFSNNPKQTEQRYGVKSVNLIQQNRTSIMKFFGTMIHHRPIIKDLDLLIIGGGGILMDLYRNAPVVYTIYNVLAKWARVPTVIYGVGAGPIESKLGKFLLKSIGNNAEVVTVRDAESKQLLKSIGITNDISVISDPAFFVKPNGLGKSAESGEINNSHGTSGLDTPNLDTDILNQIHQRENNVDLTDSVDKWLESEEQAELTKVVPDYHEKIQIGVTAVAYYDKHYWPTEDKAKYDNYINGMANNLDKILHVFPNVTVNFFSTKHPQDTHVTKDIRKLMTYHRRVTICDEGLTYESIIDFINEQDMIIGTRLHSVILAIVCKKPILAISYHRKVRDVLNLIGCHDYVIPIEEIHKNEHYFVDQFGKMHNDWDAAKRKIESILQGTLTKSPNGMELIKKHIP